MTTVEGGDAPLLLIPGVPLAFLPQFLDPTRSPFLPKLRRRERSLLGKKVNRILAKAMVVALLQMGYNLQAATVHD